jgi:AraC-like DNA-binding protein
LSERQQQAESERTPSFSTGDLDTAREQVARTFSEHELWVTDGRDLDFHLDLALSPRITLGRMRYGAAVTLTGPPMRFCYQINLPLSGESTIEQHGVRRTITAGEEGVAFLPDAPLVARWSRDALQYVIKFPKKLLEAHAAKLAGRPTDLGIRFDLTFDLRTGPAQALIATAGFLFAELARPGGLATIPTACHELEAVLMTQLLMVVPSQLSPTLHSRPTPTRRSRIREVIAFIDEHPAAETSTADLAAMADISTRTLQTGFHDIVGMSPTAYIRDVRLDRVHLELASGASGSVTEVGARWGFFHPGRFARQYRERFGVLPSETARRAVCWRSETRPSVSGLAARGAIATPEGARLAAPIRSPTWPGRGARRVGVYRETQTGAASI